MVKPSSPSSSSSHTMTMTLSPNQTTFVNNLTHNAIYRDRAGDAEKHTNVNAGNKNPHMKYARRLPQLNDLASNEQYKQSVRQHIKSQWASKPTLPLHAYESADASNNQDYDTYQMYNNQHHDSTQAHRIYPTHHRDRDTTNNNNSSDTNSSLSVNRLSLSIPERGKISRNSITQQQPPPLSHQSMKRPSVNNSNNTRLSHNNSSDSINSNAALNYRRGSNSKRNSGYNTLGGSIKNNQSTPYAYNNTHTLYNQYHRTHSHSNSHSNLNNNNNDSNDTEKHVSAYYNIIQTATKRVQQQIDALSSELNNSKVQEAMMNENQSNKQHHQSMLDPPSLQGITQQQHERDTQLLGNIQKLLDTLSNDSTSQNDLFSELHKFYVEKSKNDTIEQKRLQMYEYQQNEENELIDQQRDELNDYMKSKELSVLRVLAAYHQMLKNAKVGKGGDINGERQGSDMNNKKWQEDSKDERIDDGLSMKSHEKQHLLAMIKSLKEKIEYQQHMLQRLGVMDQDGKFIDYMISLIDKDKSKDKKSISKYEMKEEEKSVEKRDREGDDEADVSSKPVNNHDQHSKIIYALQLRLAHELEMKEKLQGEKSSLQKKLNALTDDRAAPESKSADTTHNRHGKQDLLPDHESTTHRGVLKGSNTDINTTKDDPSATTSSDIYKQLQQQRNDLLSRIIESTSLNSSLNQQLRIVENDMNVLQRQRIRDQKKVEEKQRRRQMKLQRLAFGQSVAHSLSNSNTTSNSPVIRSRGGNDDDLSTSDDDDDDLDMDMSGMRAANESIPPTPITASIGRFMNGSPNTFESMYENVKLPITELQQKIHELQESRIQLQQQISDVDQQLNRLKKGGGHSEENEDESSSISSVNINVTASASAEQQRNGSKNQVCKSSIKKHDNKEKTSSSASKPSLDRQSSKAHPSSSSSTKKETPHQREKKSSSIISHHRSPSDGGAAAGHHKRTASDAGAESEVGSGNQVDGELQSSESLSSVTDHENHDDTKVEGGDPSKNNTDNPMLAVKGRRALTYWKQQVQTLKEEKSVLQQEIQQLEKVHKKADETQQVNQTLNQQVQQLTSTVQELQQRIDMLTNSNRFNKYLQPTTQSTHHSMDSTNNPHSHDNIVDASSPSTATSGKTAVVGSMKLSVRTPNQRLAILQSYKEKQRSIINQSNSKKASSVTGSASTGRKASSRVTSRNVTPAVGGGSGDIENEKIHSSIVGSEIEADADADVDSRTIQHGYVASGTVATQQLSSPASISAGNHTTTAVMSHGPNVLHADPQSSPVVYSATGTSAAAVTSSSSAPTPIPYIIQSGQIMSSTPSPLQSYSQPSTLPYAQSTNATRATSNDQPHAQQRQPQRGGQQSSGAYPHTSSTEKDKEPTNIIPPVSTSINTVNPLPSNVVPIGLGNNADHDDEIHRLMHEAGLTADTITGTFSSSSGTVSLTYQGAPAFVNNNRTLLHPSIVNVHDVIEKKTTSTDSNNVDNIISAAIVASNREETDVLSKENQKLAQQVLQLQKQLQRIQRGEYAAEDDDIIGNGGVEANVNVSKCRNDEVTRKKGADGGVGIGVDAKLGEPASTSTTRGFRGSQRVAQQNATHVRPPQQQPQEHGVDPTTIYSITDPVKHHLQHLYKEDNNKNSNNASAVTSSLNANILPSSPTPPHPFIYDPLRPSTHVKHDEKREYLEGLRREGESDENSSQPTFIRALSDNTVLDTYDVNGEVEMEKRQRDIFDHTLVDVTNTDRSVGRSGIGSRARTSRPQSRSGALSSRSAAHIALTPSAQDGLVESHAIPYIPHTQLPASLPIIHADLSPTTHTHIPDINLFNASSITSADIEALKQIIQRSSAAHTHDDTIVNDDGDHILREFLSQHAASLTHRSDGSLDIPQHLREILVVKEAPQLLDKHHDVHQQLAEKLFKLENSIVKEQ